MRHEKEGIEMEKWDYKTMVTDGAELETLLSELGEQGWELVAMAPVAIKHEKSEGDTVTVWETTEYRLVFKCRPQP